MMPRESPTLSNTESRETGRIEAFSDGVFAIAITLLILQIAIPLHASDLLGEVLKQWPSFMAYIISFLIILIMWINHHALFEVIHHIDRNFLLLNGLLLMFITFLNYPTALVSDYLTSPAQAKIAMLIYSGTLVGIAILFNALWLYASFHKRLLSPTADPKAIQMISSAYRFGPLYYLVVFFLAFISVPASFILNAVLAIYYAIFGRS
jgi:uncharacterized membrane protein